MKDIKRDRGQNERGIVRKTERKRERKGNKRDRRWKSVGKREGVEGKRRMERQ